MPGSWSRGVAHTLPLHPRARGSQALPSPSRGRNPAGTQSVGRGGPDVLLRALGVPRRAGGDAGGHAPGTKPTHPRRAEGRGRLVVAAAAPPRHEAAFRSLRRCLRGSAGLATAGVMRRRFRTGACGVANLVACLVGGTPTAVGLVDPLHVAIGLTRWLFLVGRRLTHRGHRVVDRRGLRGIGTRGGASTATGGEQRRQERRETRRGSVHGVEPTRAPIARERWG